MRLLILAVALAPAVLYADIAGPDTFGYIARSRFEPSGIQFSFIDIRGSGTKLLQGDDHTANISLGSGFQFYGTTYNSAVVSTNGNIQFGSNSAAYINTPLSASFLGPSIFAYWDDLYFSDPNQGAFTQYFANGIHPGLSGPTTVFQWFGHYYAGPTYPFVDVQLFLEHATGRILMQYNNQDVSVRGMGTSATIGIQQGGTGGSFLQWNYNGTRPVFITETVLFMPPSAVPEPSTYALMGASLAGLSLLGRRRRRKL